MLPDVTQSFKLERPHLESCTDRAEAMLRLFIAEHFLLYKHMQPFERDRQELCVYKKTR